MAGYAERVQRKSRGEVKKIKLVGHSLSVTLSYIILIIIGIKGVIFLCIQYIIAAPLLWEVYKTKLQKGISQVILVVNNLLANAGDIRRFDPSVRKIPWRKAWQPNPVFLPGESHGQRNLVGYSPWGSKSWTQMKGLNMHAHKV